MPRKPRLVESLEARARSGFVGVCTNINCQRHGMRVDLDDKPYSAPICEGCEAAMVVYAPPKPKAA